MQCSKCKNKAVIVLQHGSLCRNHFIKHFEEKIFKTINSYQLIGRKDKICVATSGGKDSLTVLYLTQKYLQEYNIPTENLFALAIDEGISNYRENTLKDLKIFCTEHKVPLKIASFENEFGKKLEDAFPKISRDSKKKPCNVCGVWRRYLLNKYAKEFGATKVVTGHNLDDEAQVIIMNIFKANTKIAGRLGPKSGKQENKLFIQRVKPLYFCPEKEVRLYALLKKFQVNFTECPYSNDGYRHGVQDMLNSFENKYRGTKQGIVNSFMDLLPLLKEKDDGLEIKLCKICGEPANQEICNACKLRQGIKNG